MAKETTDKPQKEPGVQSIRRAFAILEAVALSPEGLTLAQLSKSVDLHTSTAFHLAKTMVAMGIIRQDENGKGYHIGARLFGLAAGATDEMELVQLAHPVLQKLAMETGENSHIAVPTPDGVVIIEKCDGSAQVRMNERVGAIRPLHATAIGKAVLCGLDDEALARYAEKADLKAITAKTITEADRLVQEIQQARRDGIAWDDTEFNEEARCMAAPVRDFSGRIIGSLGISGPVWRVGLQDLPRLGEAVKLAAEDLSAALGHSHILRSSDLDKIAAAV
jgi:IclR family transcriptional regulator, KDG regulon repressor